AAVAASRAATATAGRGAGAAPACDAAVTADAAHAAAASSPATHADAPRARQPRNEQQRREQTTHHLIVAPFEKRTKRIRTSAEPGQTWPNLITGGRGSGRGSSSRRRRGTAS